MLLSDLMTASDNQAATIVLGTVGIFISILLIVFASVFIKINVKPNPFFGYRTKFSLSSEKHWKWCNRVFAKTVLIWEPFVLVLHVLVFSLSMAFGWPCLYLLITLLLSVVFIIPVILFIEIHGRKKFGKAETSENEKGKK